MENASQGGNQMTPPSAAYGGLPFEEAAEFFGEKVAVSGDVFVALSAAARVLAFSAAGAARVALVEDMQAAVAEAIEQGSTITAFRKKFDAIVARYGWNYKGTRGWRTRLIFNTNILQSYAAGRWKQQSSETVKQVRPYLWYLESASKDQRVDHQQFYNLVLPVDDPFWDTHYPPNGFNCRCGVRSLSERELERYRSQYPISTQSPKLGTYEHTYRATGETVTVAEGCDPGFDVNPGAIWEEAN
jgi:uncharacterized protein with gpF-like domain